MEEGIRKLTGHFPRAGRVEWIGLRPAKRAPLESVASARILMGGIEGDHRRKEGLRAVTLIQHEHLAAIASLAGLKSVDPALLRRNVAVSGISLHALKGRRFRLGDAMLEGSEDCPPCSRMEELLGEGGYNAMRGHGGLCACVVEEGAMRIGDEVRAVQGA